MTSYIDQSAKLDPSGRIVLVEVDASEFGAGVHRMHYAPFPHSAAEIEAAAGDEAKLGPKPIYFGGLMFDFWPFSVSGLSLSTEQAATPTITVSNLAGYLSRLCLDYRDLINAKVRVIYTYAEYLDARNFPDGNPNADPDACSYQTFWVDTKSAEDDESITWTLSSPADLQGLKIPTRQITSLCTWAMRGQYRSGDGCTYNGNAYFDAKGNPVSDPALDRCGGCYSDCVKRFGADMADPKAAALDFGGFLAAQLINR
ncbi:minor tail protein l [Edwardsiella phage eiAU-183]|uniref:Minor tail protein l n=4 Tax=Viruses TaxID=10239 RepID=E7EKQ8_9CAUD|nr:minor tail protein [Edwardsiella phage eiAU-183]YP_009613853.1 minor tail protein [Edwardsiella phage eiAU]ADV36467.1 phage minor tail protein l [Edwardsiella phage eiDWF]ADV36517.1 phage minor tail protein l [Edwardsiella phage eiMSLS]ADV36413.1 phage minor tail protein l [Edwardsiella phage eiAU]AHG23419.1 minor tail protein l [Edwardsiella phage eiAU]AHG23473.1 minor tail protein l [Edwardsiella phage eiAU-183]